MIIHLDGVLSQQTIAKLEEQIVDYTGIPLDEALQHRQEHEQVSASQFAQLLIIWRFLEQVNHHLSELSNYSFS